MDIKCCACGEAWDYVGARNGDMEPWEWDLFVKGVGCPGCKGEPEVEYGMPTTLSDIKFGDDDPAIRLEAFENRAAGKFKGIAWEPPPPPPPVRGDVWDAADPDERMLLDATTEELENLGSFRYGDLHNLDYGYCDNPVEVVVPKLMSGSDYSGSSIERANYAAFLEQFKDVKGVYETYGGHGTYGVVILASVDNKEIADTLRALADYPVVDEEKLSEIELELQNEAWENWAKSEFIRELERVFNLDDLEIDAHDKWDEMIHQLMDSGKAEWIHETGGDAWIDVKRLAQAVEWEDLRECCTFVDLDEQDSEAEIADNEGDNGNA